MVVKPAAYHNGNRCLWGRWGMWALLLGVLALPVQAEVLPVQVTGVEAPLARNVRNHVRQLGLASETDARRQQALIRRKARVALEALGHYAADIQLQIQGHGGDADILLHIQPGEPVRWQDTGARLEGAGATDPALLDVLARHSPRTGEPLHHDHYERLKKELRLVAQRQGYFDARFTRQQLRVDRPRHRADLDLTFATGERYRFGTVVLGRSRLRQSALRRFVPFQPGEPYDETRMTELNRHLLDSGYFSTVTLNPLRVPAGEGQPPRVDVQVDLLDNAPNRVSTGIGYGTDTGARISLGWLKPLLNSRGHSLQLSTSLSEPRREATAQYKIPDGKPGLDFWLLQTGYLEETFENTQYSLFSYGVSRQQQVWGGWQRTLFTNVRHENGYIEGEYVENRPSDAFYVAPGISFSHLDTDGGLHPARGHKFSVDLEFSDPNIGSDTEYVRLQGQLKYLFPLTDRQQLLLRGQAGMIWSNDFSQVPVSVRFYAGGDQSIRGYDYNSLSPVDDSGNLTGGSRLLLGGVDYLYRVLPNWQAALFIDHGGALDETNQPFFSGAGVGVRWLSPVGNLSLDVAQAQAGETEGDFRVHISMGTVL